MCLRPKCIATAHDFDTCQLMRGNNPSSQVFLWKLEVSNIRSWILSRSFSFPSSVVERRWRGENLTSNCYHCCFFYQILFVSHSWNCLLSRVLYSTRQVHMMSVIKTLGYISSDTHAILVDLTVHTTTQSRPHYQTFTCLNPCFLCQMP